MYMKCSLKENFILAALAVKVDHIWVLFGTGSIFFFFNEPLLSIRGFHSQTQRYKSRFLVFLLKLQILATLCLCAITTRHCRVALIAARHMLTRDLLSHLECAECWSPVLMPRTCKHYFIQ